MSLDALVEEIHRRAEADLGLIQAKRSAEESRIARERDQKITQIHADQVRTTESEVSRIRAQRLAAAKVSARKKVYEARERRLQSSLDSARDILEKYTASDDYTETLRRMVAEATNTLGKQVRISGRTEDAARLAKVAGKTFDPTPRSILGGIVAETLDGNRRLNLSFDELLRLKEGRVRELLA